ncbi:hypothetical protein EVAR_58191_1 [Eumeta japonica]|uniref:Retrovirus-related Pol polyprotein from transposon 297 n=1 Tax=Eumeta variegata TaxID=151549 RepID=A0A4C1YPL1_EUMVA|nr:hypothetical protein EVAR_58191_1 [Eumeta japonica]
MERLQFEVELAADEDPKNNIIIIKSITKRMERHISYRQVSSSKTPPSIDKVTRILKIKKHYRKEKNASQSAKEYISHSEDKKNGNQEIETKELKSGILHYEINSNEGIDVKKFDIDTTYLEHDQKIKISALLNDYKHIFAKDKYDIGQVKNYEAFIDLQVEKYCSKRPYRCSLDDKKEIEKQIEQLLKNELIEESYSPFAAPVTLAFKRDEGKSQDCV